jgi:putative nucleotidyltransferase with HDIG domain
VTTSLVESLLRDLQGAIAVRRLYPPEHPRLVELLDRVVESAAQATSGSHDVDAFCLDGRVVSKGVPLSGSDAFVKGLFAALATHGFHRITVRHGLTIREAAAFVDALAAPETGQAPTSSAHLRLSAYDNAAEAPTHQPERTLSAEEHDRLYRVWDGVVRHRAYDLDAMEFMLLALSQTIGDSMGAAIPLAALKSHDDYTITHIVNVALLSMALAEAVGFSTTLVRDVGVSALLHDVGKLHVPAAVLNEGGRLSDEQRRIIRGHPEHGARILLSTAGVPQLAVTVAFEHHLQYDGGGYPTVPRSWKMNLASEITHIADVFDALRSNRPYRAALPRDRIVEIMMRDAGTVFDPGLVRTFFDLVVPRAAEAA